MLLYCGAQNGQAPLSDLQCTTSSEALLAGKAPTFRLLVWAIDRHTGEQLYPSQATCLCMACAPPPYSRWLVWGAARAVRMALLQGRADAGVGL